MNTSKKKLFLVDAMALIYRAHFAFINNPRLNSKGLNTSAIFGFLNSLLEIIDKQKPTHLAVAFDSYGPTLRHTDFTEYKANRDKQPEDITLSLPYIRAILSGFNIPLLEIPGYEADDIIATLAKNSPSDEFDVYMFTPDKDYAQLVDNHIFLFKPGRSDKPSEIWDVERVTKEFGIERTEQVIEIQGLTGDAVDNIPGVPGIGPKTAQTLIAEYGDIETLLKNTNKLKGKVKENLEKFADQARLSRILAKLICDAPVNINTDELIIKEWDKETLEEIFAELEFKALGKKILGKEPEKKQNDNNIGQMELSFSGEKKSELIAVRYKSISEEEEIAHLLKRIKEQGKFSFSLQTDVYNKVFGISVAVNPFEAWFIPILDNHFPLKVIFEDAGIKKLGYDLKSALQILNKHNIQIYGDLFDLQIAHYIIDSEIKHDFDLLCESYLKEKVPSDFELDPSTVPDNACRKADYIVRISSIFEKIIEQNNFQKVFYSLECPLIKVLAKMENDGVKIDESILKEYSIELEKDLKQLESQIHKLSGMGFNVNSPQQLGYVLFDILKLDPEAKKTKKSKQYSTGEEVLQKLSGKHEIVNMVLDYRGIQKLKSTYVDALPLIVNKDSGLIHTTYEQTVAATGRLSSRNPNLQNIPIRTERGRFVRKAFIPRDNNRSILSADYSQIELRVVAHSSGDVSMIESFNQNLDIHTATAAKVFHVNLEEVTKDMRRKAKEVNFGIIYGISSWGLAQRLAIPKKEGAEIIEHYFESYPGIRNYINECIEKARKNGYSETIFGRRRYLRDIESRNAMQRSFAERNAINAPVQGSAADIIKVAMIDIQNALSEEKLESKMIMQVHDELVFDVLNAEIEIVRKMVKTKMENAIQLSVPLLVDIGVGSNWLEAH